MDTYQFTDLTIRDYSEKLASSHHIPGGGSVSGICANFAISLVKMVLAISIVEFDDSQKSDFERLEANRLELFNWIDADSRNFDFLMKTFSLPKDTEKQKEFRKAQIHSAYIEAARAPYQIYLILERTKEISNRYISLIKKSVYADLTLSQDLIALSQKNCLENIEANKLTLEQCKELFSQSHV